MTSKYFNRDLSWLEFNRRVLYQVEDKKNPLLERVRFLSIFTSNLDEFYMKRVGILKTRISRKVEVPGADGLFPSEALEACRKVIIELQSRQHELFHKEITKELTKNGVHLLEWSSLNRGEKDYLKARFDEQIFPILTPLAVDPAHPFPFVSNLSVSMGVKLRANPHSELLFARVKVPDILPQWIRLPTEGVDDFRMVRLNDVIFHNLTNLFPGMNIEGVMPFRVTRNANVALDDEGTDDVIEVVEEHLRQRRLARVVRLEHGANPDPWMLDLLKDEVEISDSDVYEHPGELNYRALGEIANLKLPNLKYKRWTPGIPKPFQDESDVFKSIRDNDIMVHHPYDSFNASVERFILAAVDDPKVVAIKMTIYRTGEESPFIPLLIDAAERGKQVVCVLEVKARFDEERNLYWAEKLESAGVHVCFGVMGLKTHSKLSLVVRQEGSEVSLYAHVGTGNYNHQTARIYTDMGIFTSNREITSEVVEVFNSLTGISKRDHYDRLLVSPVNQREKFIELILGETALAKKGKKARIIAKFNQLEDVRIIDLLYEASQAGVQIDLIVRGFCKLRPGVKNLSENIRVISIVGRYLEHSRIFYFGKGQKDPVDGDFYIGSADWMRRNLDERVEVSVPVVDRAIRARIWSVLELMLNDGRLAWKLNPKGSYSLQSGKNFHSEGSHDCLMRLSKERQV